MHRLNSGRCCPCHRTFAVAFAMNNFDRIVDAAAAVAADYLRYNLDMIDSIGFVAFEDWSCIRLRPDNFDWTSLRRPTVFARFLGAVAYRRRNNHHHCHRPDYWDCHHIDCCIGSLEAVAVGAAFVADCNGCYCTDVIVDLILASIETVAADRTIRVEALDYYNLNIVADVADAAAAADAVVVAVDARWHLEAKHNRWMSVSAATTYVASVRHNLKRWPHHHRRRR